MPRITIATDNTEVKWAAEFLKEETLEAVGCSSVSALQEQLWRFEDVTWELIPSDDPELVELHAWAKENFRPGRTSVHRVLTLRDSRQIERHIRAA